MNFNYLDYDNVNIIHRGDTEECCKIIPPRLYNFLFFQEIKIASLFFTCLVFHVYINSSKSKIELKSSKYYFPHGQTPQVIYQLPSSSLPHCLLFSFFFRSPGELNTWDFCIPLVGLLIPAFYILLFFLICSFFVEASFILTS